MFLPTQRTRKKTRDEPADPVSLERGVRQLLAQKITGNQVGTWLLIPEHLRLGVWDLLCGWTGQTGATVFPRLALQLVHEAALCHQSLRERRTLSQKGFEVANGLPFVASDTAIHELLDAHTVAEAQALQIALGKIRRASHHFQGQLLAIDPHRLKSASQRQMRRHKFHALDRAGKVTNTFFCLDADTHEPVCFTIGTSARTAAQATPELLALAQTILQSSPGQALVLADCEHFTAELIAHVADHTPYDLLVPMPRHPGLQRQITHLPDSVFTPRWAGFATAQCPFQFCQHPHDPPYRQWIQRSGESADQYDFKAFLATADRSEVESLSLDYPKRWHVEEFFNAHQALGWQRAGTLNLNIRYGRMSLALVAQASLSQLRRRLGPPWSEWDAEHLAQDLLGGLEGDLRVKNNQVVVTYYNAPQADALRQHYEGLPEKLRKEGVDPRVPWLFNYELDFRFA